MLEIGKIKLNSNLFLGPMAGYTERVFRSLCLKKGAALAFTEMVSCEGLFRDSKNTMALMTRGKCEENLAVQLFMPNEESAARSLENVMKANPQILDINCGCPVPKVVKTGCGSALLRTPETIGKIVKVLCTTGLPVTVKIRTGWDKNSINYLEVANKAFDNGAAAVCMHARTKSQLYSPVADWKALKDLKAHFPEKTIIGSGDLFTAADGKLQCFAAEFNANDLRTHFDYLLSKRGKHIYKSANGISHAGTAPDTMPRSVRLQEAQQRQPR